MLRKNQIGTDPLSLDEEKEWFIQHSKGKGFQEGYTEVIPSSYQL